MPKARRPRPGLRLHVSAVPDDERTVRDGIPITTVPRTLLDLAAVLPRHAVGRAVHEAEVQRLGDPLSLADLVERHPGRRGVATVRAILADLGLGARVTRSELEDAFVAFLDRHELPRPGTNRLVEGFEVDCVWPEARLVVELDGHATHATRRTFEADRRRDRALAVAGLRVVRVTWRQLHDASDALAHDLRALLLGA